MKKMKVLSRAFKIKVIFKETTSLITGVVKKNELFTNIIIKENNYSLIRVQKNNLITNNSNSKKYN